MAKLRGSGTAFLPGLAQGEPSCLCLQERELSARSRRKLTASSYKQAPHPHQGNSSLCVPALVSVAGQ